MGKPLVSDELWSLVAPLLPPEPPKGAGSRGGRPRLDNRRVLTGILFVLKTGIPWSFLPQEMGCGTGVSCWRRLKEWQEAGVWNDLHATLLSQLAEADRLDWSRVSVDSASVPAPLVAKKGKAKQSGLRR